MTVSITITLDERPQFARAFGPEHLPRRIHAGLLRVAANAKALILSRDKIPRNTGALRASIAASLSSDPARGEVRFGSPFRYAIVMENGRRPGRRMPPPAALALWARRKLGLSEAKARGVGFAIAKKIARAGIAIPLKSDKRGGMFGDAWPSVRSSAGGWFRLGFLAARV